MYTKRLYILDTTNLSNQLTLNSQSIKKVRQSMKNQQSIAKNSDNKDDMEALQQQQIDEMCRQPNRWDKKEPHPNSIKAIEPYQFKKGESGNAKGRPLKNTNLAKELQSIGDDSVVLSSLDADLWNDGVSDLGTNKKMVLEKIWELARNGDKDMIKLLVQVGGLE